MYSYTESGLRNIYLVNGFKHHKTAYGKGVAFYNIESLHHIIKRDLCAFRPRLTGLEFRFLRHELDLSQAALFALVGSNEQAVALREKSKVKVPVWADRLMRALYREHMGENVKIRKLIEDVAEPENSKPLPTRCEAKVTAKGWILKAVQEKSRK